MARFRDFYSSFLAGEISPKSIGRVDVPQYKQACETLENMIVHPQGGVSKRAGSQYFEYDFKNYSGVSVDLDKAVMFPFVISDTQKYMIIFTGQDLGLASGDLLLDGLDILVYDMSNPSVGAMTNMPIFRTYGGGGFGNTRNIRRYEFLTTQAELDQIQMTQLGDVAFFAQRGMVPIALRFEPTLFGSPAWALYNHWQFLEITGNEGLVDTGYAKGVPYDSRNNTSITMQISVAATGNSRTLTCSSAVFTERDIGRLVRTTNAANTQTGVAVIGSTAGTVAAPSTTATADVLVAFADTVATTNWAFSSWSRTGYSNSIGYPSSVWFYEGRLMYALGASVWSSQTNSIRRFNAAYFEQDSPKTFTPSDPMAFSIAASEPADIRWGSPGKAGISLGTNARQYLVNAPDASAGLATGNISASPESATGANATPPVRKDNAIYFVDKSGRKLYELLFNFQEDAFKPSDLTVFAEHISRRTEEVKSSLTLGTIKRLALQSSEASIIWALDSNDGLFGMTRDIALEITAFHYHKIAGSLGAAPAKVLSMCTLPSPTNDHDDVWMLVRRTIDGSAITYLEKIGRQFDRPTVDLASTNILDRPVFMDSAMMVQAASSTVFSGFDHLEGETVSVIADGLYVGEKVVSSGDITLDEAATEVIAGLGYRAILKPTNFNMGSVLGISQAVTKSVDTFTARFYRTIGAKFGSSLDDLEDINFRDPTLPNDDPIQPYSGDLELAFKEGWDNKLHIVFVQDIPLPMHVMAIAVRGITND
jgi:hypothetical protein